MAGPREHVLIIDPGSTDPLVGWPGQVRHTVSSRVALVDADDTAIEALRARPGVLGVYAAIVPPHVTAALDDTERLFIEAWHLRNEPKRRPADGVDWGERGFEPPDA